MTELLRWQWMIFLAPFTLAVLLALASAAGVGAAAEGEAGSDATDHESDADHEADADHEGDAEGAHSPLALIGVGHAPLSVLLISLLLFWSVIGGLGNLGLGVGHIGISVSLALVGSLVATGAVARLIKRFLPMSQSFSVARHELIGREGVAIYPITQSSGTVRLHDKLGTLRQLDSRVVAGEAVIAQDTKVIIIDYDREQQVFTVQKWDDLVRTTKED